MDSEVGDHQLALCLYRLVREYVRRKTESRSGQKYEDFRNDRDEKGRIIYPQKYREEREKVCSDAFLAMRARRDQDFIGYFTGTVCSVPQYLPEDDYLAVGHALIADWEKVKTLAMLAVSACSGLARDGQDKGGSQQ